MGQSAVQYSEVRLASEKESRLVGVFAMCHPSIHFLPHRFLTPHITPGYARNQAMFINVAYLNR
jgi:hypothetical protein